MTISISEQILADQNAALETIKRIADQYEQPTDPAGTAPAGGEHDA